MAINSKLAHVIGCFRAGDQALGDFTYLGVKFVVLSTTATNSYGGLVAGVLISLTATCSLRALVDRNVDRMRDAVRGGPIGVAISAHAELPNVDAPAI